ncbi:hypothetical protein TraAM80_08832 [Trypanosoma rangeli]|uniref:Uncharacterized protein n=1 Tax=Trypanosoma rangeli TaxID=5698 RepID=A0A422MYL5_TRYRA|nr:uncharacterized protein TraAM80_08832 [Trypanosoma rangeli]RNE98334.1 hypothetical protein TraAM80_08832 [Trypanosoma rangeli]|eukprot:RNE98334.1 hypothetical protein TraAM80_08832 [Trypanosoma rangeli]
MALLATAASNNPVAMSSPMIAPGVVRSLYRMLLREVVKLDKSSVSKTLFPLTKELQAITKNRGPLYVPNGVKYLDILREVFRDGQSPANVNLAFDTLTRMRTHNEKVTAKVSLFMKDHTFLMSTLQASRPKTGTYRAEPAACVVQNGPMYAPLGDPTFSVPTKVVLRQTRTVDLAEGVALVAHPLSSTHVDRRVMLITERNPHVTTAVVLDMLFTYPLSRGNPMFPEVFWGHEVHDGGSSQIGFTMPPTAQISILHTTEPPTEPASPQYLAWIKWNERKAKSKVSDVPSEHHSLLCKPLIRGGTLEDGTVEPTLYLSKVEALPYLAQLVPGQPRSSLRVYWGSMRWPTQQLEAEVANGHWFPVKLSPSFFRPFPLLSESGGVVDRFPTKEELEEARTMRERRYGVDVSLPQAFPPDQIMRRRECLWDEIMYCLGGEFSALVGCVNPFSGTARGVLPLEVAGPSVMGASLPAEDAGALLSEEDELEEAESDDDGDEHDFVLSDAPMGGAAPKGDGDAAPPTPPAGGGNDKEKG